MIDTMIGHLRVLWSCVAQSVQATYMPCSALALGYPWLGKGEAQQTQLEALGLPASEELQVPT